MPNKKNSNQGGWVRWGIRFALGVIILAMAIDYGKHLILKSVLENEIAQSEGIVSLKSLSVSLWPLFENHLVLTNFHVNVSGTPLAAAKVKIRQGWKEWRRAHIEALDVTSADTVRIQEAQGILDTAALSTHVKVSDLILKGISARLPLISFSGPEASFDFLYEMATHQLSLQMDAPEMSFSNGATFGLNGQGMIDTNPPIKGKMDVKIKNIDKMLKELVAAGVIHESQADLVTTGSNFFSKIGLHDISLPLRIQDEEVSLGPVILFKWKQSQHNLNTNE